MQMILRFEVEVDGEQRKGSAKMVRRKCGSFKKKDEVCSNFLQ